MSSPLHQPVSLDIGMAPLVCVMDGRNSYDELLAISVQALEDGVLAQNGKAIKAAELTRPVSEVARQILDKLLIYI